MLKTWSIQAVKEIRPIGPNEFQGIACRYRTRALDGIYYERGSLSGSMGKSLLLFYEHQSPIGACQLWESESGDEIRIHGRISPITVVGEAVLKALHNGGLRGLCLHAGIDEGAWCELDGKPIFRIKRAHVLEVSILLVGAIPGTGISRLGPFDLSIAPWDRQFAEGHYFLLAKAAEITQLHASNFKTDLASFTGPQPKGNFDEWITRLF